jgi:hypothetical protein
MAAHRRGEEEEPTTVRRRRKKKNVGIFFPKNIGKMLVQLFMKNVGSTFCLKNVASTFFVEKCCNICWKNVGQTFPKTC